MTDNKDIKIEYVSGAIESTDNQLYSASPAPVVVKEQTVLSIVGLILAFPFPIIIIILWATLHVIKQHNQALGEGAMTAVFLYFLQFFVVPIFSLTSVIIGFIVTLRSKDIAKKIGYISFGITGIGLLILGLFLNNT